jgi:hypothetical protein
MNIFDGVRKIIHEDSGRFGKPQLGGTMETSVV